MSAFIIYNPNTWKSYRHANGQIAVYQSSKVASAQRTKLINKGIITEDWVVDPYADYIANEPMVTVRSLMTNAPVAIRKSQCGTCTDPSMECFWTM